MGLILEDMVLNGRVAMIYSRSYACGLEMGDVTGGKIQDAPSWAILVIHGVRGIYGELCLLHLLYIWILHKYSLVMYECTTVCLNLFDDMHEAMHNLHIRLS